MKLVSPDEMRAIDSYAINVMGVAGITLMENAALKITKQAVEMLGGVFGRELLLLAGKGNNGGDAFACARLLAGLGALPCVFVFADRASISGDAKTNLERLGEAKITVTWLTEAQAQAQADSWVHFQEQLQECSLVIDGLFGTGFKGEPAGIYKRGIDLVNNSGKPVLAIDIPSGLNGLTGKAMGSCIRAKCTVSLGLSKIGFYENSGPDYTGSLVTVDIGIPEEAVLAQNITVNLVDKTMVQASIPKRKRNSNKGDYGRVLIVTGSTGMTGSGRLACEASLRAGAGLVYIGVPESLAPIYGTSLIEPIVIPLQDAGKGRLTEGCIPGLLTRFQKMDAAAVGPGLTADGEILSIVKAVLKNVNIPLVLDADALNALSMEPSVLSETDAAVIITPHPGEMARLLGITVRAVQEDRIATARAFAKKYKVITVLKGAGTVTAMPNGSVYVNSTGNPGMATGGSGDVLTGIIAALAAQGIDPAEAAIAGVWLHGRAGDRAAVKYGEMSMIAGDIISELPGAIIELSDGEKA